MATKRTASEILSEQYTKRRILDGEAKIIQIKKSDLEILNNSNVSSAEFHPSYASGSELKTSEIENPTGFANEHQTSDSECTHALTESRQAVLQEVQTVDSQDGNSCEQIVVELESEEKPQTSSELNQDESISTETEDNCDTKDCSLEASQEDQPAAFPRPAEEVREDTGANQTPPISETLSSKTEYVSQQSDSHKVDDCPPDEKRKADPDEASHQGECCNQTNSEHSAVARPLQDSPPTSQQAVVPYPRPGFTVASQIYSSVTVHQGQGEVLPADLHHPPSGNGEATYLSVHQSTTVTDSTSPQTSYPGYITGSYLPSAGYHVVPNPTFGTLPPSSLHTIYQIAGHSPSSLPSSSEDSSQSAMDSSEETLIDHEQRRLTVSEPSFSSSVTSALPQVFVPSTTQSAHVESVSTDSHVNQPITVSFLSDHNSVTQARISTMGASGHLVDAIHSTAETHEIHMPPPPPTDPIYKPESIAQFIVKDPNDQDKLPNPEQLSDAVEHCVSSLYSSGDPNHHNPLPELQLHHSDLVGGEAGKENNYYSMTSHSMAHGASYPGHHHSSMVMQRPYWAARPQGPPCTCRHHGHPKYRSGPYPYPQCRCCGPQPSMPQLHGCHMGQSHMYPGMGHHRSYSAGSGMCPSGEDRHWQRRSSSCCDLNYSRNGCGLSGPSYLHMDNSPKHPPPSSVLRAINSQSSGDYNPDSPGFHSPCQRSTSWHSYSSCTSGHDNLPDHSCPSLSCHLEGGDLMYRAESALSTFWPYPNNQLFTNLPPPGLGRTKYLVSSYIDYLIAENERITEMSKAFTPPTYLHLEEEQYVLQAHRDESPFPSNKFSKWVKNYFPQVDIISVPESKADENTTSISQLSLSNKPLNEFMRTVFFGCQDMQARKKLQAEVTEVPITAAPVTVTSAVTETIASA